MDGQTDNSKTICPLIFQYGGIKIPNFRKNNTFFPSLPGFGPVSKTISKNAVMDLIGPELSELSALEFENLPYLILCTL